MIFYCAWSHETIPLKSTRNPYPPPRLPRILLASLLNCASIFNSASSLFRNIFTGVLYLRTLGKVPSNLCIGIFGLALSEGGKVAIGLGGGGLIKPAWEGSRLLYMSCTQRPAKFQWTDLPIRIPSGDMAGLSRIFVFRSHFVGPSLPFSFTFRLLHTPAPSYHSTSHLSCRF
jgi:hypothetical protein